MQTRGSSPFAVAGAGDCSLMKGFVIACAGAVLAIVFLFAAGYFIVGMPGVRAFALA
jgi:hypothetical protein